jgi:hypothetical protein
MWMGALASPSKSPARKKSKAGDGGSTSQALEIEEDEEDNGLKGGSTSLKTLAAMAVAGRTMLRRLIGNRVVHSESDEEPPLPPAPPLWWVEATFPWGCQVQANGVPPLSVQAGLWGCGGCFTRRPSTVEIFKWRKEGGWHSVVS